MNTQGRPARKIPKKKGKPSPVHINKGKRGKK